MLQKIKDLLLPEEPGLIPAEFLDKIKDMLKYTPDLAKLQERSHHFLFVADDLKRGHRRHDLLQGGEFWAQAFTKSSFTLWKHNLGKETFPIPLEQRTRKMDFLKIRGEVHLLPTKTVRMLDEYRENGVQFIRKRVRVAIPYQNIRLDEDARVTWKSRTRDQHMMAHMYVGIPEYWNNLINDMQFSTAHHQPIGPVGSPHFYDFIYRDYFENPKQVKWKYTSSTLESGAK